MSTTDADREFDSLLDYLKRTRSFDFSSYRRAGLMRRVRRRMQLVEIGGFADYIDYLEVHPDEFSHLFDSILINVTGFFRDAAHWEYLTTDIIPSILANRDGTKPVRIWSAGCASGEEAYTLALVFCEAIGYDSFKEHVKIYCTDVDQDALNKARLATYTPQQLSEVPPPLVEKYFDQSAGHYVFKKELRRVVIFGRHDLIRDAPISRIDLLVCRNTLMYFNVETQSRILARFHFALNDTGFLFLGNAEALLAYADLFAPADLKHRVYKKVSRVNARDRFPTLARAAQSAAGGWATDPKTSDLIIELSPVAQVVLDNNGLIMTVNERARSLLGLNGTEAGRKFSTLELPFPPSQVISAIEKTYTERRVATVKDIELLSKGGPATDIDVLIIPLTDDADAIIGLDVNFLDVSRAKMLEAELLHTGQELQTAIEELNSTNEELETTNEELQSTVEELETTNEELQSSNEELETLNEELQATNEELQTVNDQLQQRSEEVNQLNDFMNSIFSSLYQGVVVTDRDLHVQIWNRKSEDLWGLRSDEVYNKNFLNLDIGLPAAELLPHLRAALAGSTTDNRVNVQATNRRGKTIECRTIFAPLLGREGAVEGVIMLLDELSD